MVKMTTHEAARCLAAFALFVAETNGALFAADATCTSRATTPLQAGPMPALRSGHAESAAHGRAAQQSLLRRVRSLSACVEAVRLAAMEDSS